MFRFALIALVVLPALLSGCLGAQDAVRGADPCDEPAVADDGTLVQPDEPYWTLTTDRTPIPDGQARVDEIPPLSVSVDGEEISTVTREATVAGEPWMERWWACRLAELDTHAAKEGSEFQVEAGAEDVERVKLFFLYRDPDGREIAYAPDPNWESETHVLTERLHAINPGVHDAFAVVAYADGASRTHHFKVRYG